MPYPENKVVAAINDFSSGEVDADMKRGNDSIVATGGRQMLNWRILNSRKKSNRPGRSALFLETGRVDEVLMSPGNKFYLVFGAGYLRVYNAAGTLVFSSTKKGDGVTVPWTFGTIKNIVTATAASVGNPTVYIFYGDGAPKNVPQVLSWDGVSQTSTWTLSTFAEEVLTNGQKRTPFYRLSPQGITMQPSGTSGSVSLTFNAPVLTAAMVGVRFLYCGRQLLLTGYTDSMHGTASVIETLPGGMTMALSVLAGSFNVGDEVKGGTSGAAGVVTNAPTQQVVRFSSSVGLPFGVGGTVTGSPSGASGTVVAEAFYSQWNVTIAINGSTFFAAGDAITDGTNTFTLTDATTSTFAVQILANSSNAITNFVASETIVGPSGTATVNTPTGTAPQAVSIWDDEVMNGFRGYPTSGFFDQSRLGLCNIPSVPSGVIWSAIGIPNDFYIQATSASNAIFEFAPSKVQVLYVVPGMEGAEFIFTDKGVFYIPINQNVPLSPGTVSFNEISAQGCAAVQPQRAQQTILYVKSGGVQIGAVQVPGAYYRPYVIDDVAEFHSHLFTASAPIAIAVPDAATQFQEFYAYILLANGNLVVGKYGIRGGLLDVGQEGKPKVGWVPWNGAGTVTWVSAQSSDVIFTTSYAPNAVPTVSVVEQLDNTQYLDCALFVNNLPAPFTPPGGNGPLYKFPGPNSTVYLIDLGTRFMGTYQVDANGFLVPQNQDGENLLSAQLVAGQQWTAIYEPFMPQVPGGQDEQQRMRRRKIGRGAVSVQDSSGFVFGGVRVPAYFVGDNQAAAAILREDTYRIRPPGRAFDPRLPLTKDTPGPLTVLDYDFEVSV